MRTLSSVVLSLLFASFVILACPLELAAQTPHASLVGDVRDPHSAPVPPALRRSSTKTPA